MFEGGTGMSMSNVRVFVMVFYLALDEQRVVGTFFRVRKGQITRFFEGARPKHNLVGLYRYSRLVCCTLYTSTNQSYQ